MKSNWTAILSTVIRKKVPFLLVFFVVFTTSYATLSWLDFLPEPKVSTETTSGEAKDGQSLETDKIMIETITSPVEPENTSLTAILPMSIKIDALDRTVKVLNPTSHKIEDLDADLLRGAVRHPDSASLNQKGTVFILGHSSYLPAVKNPNFQAFNGLQNLKWGDTITIFAEEGEFIYRVDRVYKANARDHVVSIAGDTMKLVLATCNSFGSSDDRYIVEADLVEKTIY